jgi:hypothetical protein
MKNTMSLHAYFLVGILILITFAAAGIFNQSPNVMNQGFKPMAVLQTTPTLTPGVTPTVTPCTPGEGQNDGDCKYCTGDGEWANDLGDEGMPVCVMCQDMKPKFVYEINPAGDSDCLACNPETGDLGADPSGQPGLCLKCENGAIVPNDASDVPGDCRKCVNGEHVVDQSDWPQGVCQRCDEQGKFVPLCSSSQFCCADQGHQICCSQGETCCYKYSDRYTYQTQWELSCVKGPCPSLPPGKTPWVTAK